MGRYPFLAWAKEYLESVSGLYAEPTVKELDRRYRRMSKDLKARGFRWEPISKTWRFVLTEYYAFRVSCGRLQDCKVRRHPEPINWIVDVAKALGVEV